MSLAEAKQFAVAAWNLDEESGQRADSVGEHNLTATDDFGDGDVFAVNAKFGKGAKFKNLDADRLFVASSTNLQTGDVDFFLRCWFQLDSKDSFRWIARKSGEWDCYYDSNIDRVKFLINNADGANPEVIANNFGSASIGQLYLLHAWHNADSDEIGIAINNQENTADTAGVSATPSSNNFEMGAGILSSVYMDGVIDDCVFLKNRILTAAERTEDYNGGDGVAFANWDAPTIAADESQVSALYFESDVSALYFESDVSALYFESQVSAR